MNAQAANNSSYIMYFYKILNNLQNMDSPPRGTFFIPELFYQVGCDHQLLGKHIPTIVQTSVWSRPFSMDNKVERSIGMKDEGHEENKYLFDLFTTSQAGLLFFNLLKQYL